MVSLKVVCYETCIKVAFVHPNRKNVQIKRKNNFRKCLLLCMLVALVWFIGRGRSPLFRKPVKSTSIAMIKITADMVVDELDLLYSWKHEQEVNEIECCVTFVEIVVSISRLLNRSDLLLLRHTHVIIARCVDLNCRPCPSLSKRTYSCTLWIQGIYEWMHRLTIDCGVAPFVWSVS